VPWAARYMGGAMQVVVNKRDLVRIVARCQGVADKRSTMPMLGNVLVETEGTGLLKLSATDLYLGLTGTITAEVETAGTVAVGARDLFERVKMMPEGEILLSAPGQGSLVIRARGQARRYTLKGIPGADFPSLPKPTGAGEVLELATQSLALLIHRTHFSIAVDDTRLHLNSALLQWEGDRVRMVTTDGHRLSKMEIQGVGSNAFASMLIPLKGVQELRRLCDEAVAEGIGTVSIVQHGPNAFFRAGTLQLSVKLVDVQFPPYQQVIPASAQHRVVANRALLGEALRAVAIAASERTGGVKISFAPNVMRFASESPESGDGFDELAIEFEGTPTTVGFNAHYLLQAIGCIEQEAVALGISGELDAATLQPAEQATSESYLAVVMPMRI
jgi:DNA polymerase III subunit beta